MTAKRRKPNTGKLTLKQWQAKQRKLVKAWWQHRKALRAAGQLP